ncbi:hypothetical protein [Streptomyces sp. NPDC054783]
MSLYRTDQGDTYDKGDVTIALTIQRHLLLCRAVPRTTVETAHMRVPSEEGGGGGFDIFSLSGARTALVVGAVAGQGTSFSPGPPSVGANSGSPKSPHAGEPWPQDEVAAPERPDGSDSSKRPALARGATLVSARTPPDTGRGLGTTALVSTPAEAIATSSGRICRLNRRQACHQSLSGSRPGTACQGRLQI